MGTDLVKAAASDAHLNAPAAKALWSWALERGDEEILTALVRNEELAVPKELDSWLDANWNSTVTAHWAGRAPLDEVCTRVQNSWNEDAAIVAAERNGFQAESAQGWAAKASSCRLARALLKLPRLGESDRLCAAGLLARSWDEAEESNPLAFGQILGDNPDLLAVAFEQKTSTHTLGAVAISAATAGWARSDLDQHIGKAAVRLGQNPMNSAKKDLATLLNAMSIRAGIEPSCAKNLLKASEGLGPARTSAISRIQEALTKNWYQLGRQATEGNQPDQAWAALDMENQPNGRYNDILRTRFIENPHANWGLRTKAFLRLRIVDRSKAVRAVWDSGQEDFACALLNACGSLAGTVLAGAGPDERMEETVWQQAQNKADFLDYGPYEANGDYVLDVKLQSLWPKPAACARAVEYLVEKLDAEQLALALTWAPSWGATVQELTWAIQDGTRA